MNARKVTIDPLSARSLYLKLIARDSVIGEATGFVVEYHARAILITNWHVLSGRHPESNRIQSATGAVPDLVRIAHHGSSLGTWELVDEPIFDPEGHARWFEHPSGRNVDLVALPLTRIADSVTIYPLDLRLAETDMIPQVAMPVSIVGFPLGLAAAGALPIWKTGHIASDPDIDYQGTPAFVIDATTRGGMSGSPVVLRLSGGFRTASGRMVLAGGPQTRFLGVYSGRIHAESEIGIVWRPKLIQEILERIV
jgi:hypothetical protein